MKPSTKRWLSRIVRWGIAVVGVVYVLYNIPLRDRVRVLKDGQLQAELVFNDATDAQPTFVVGDDRRTVDRDQLWTLPDRKSIDVRDAAGGVRGAKLLAVRPVPDDPGRRPAELLIEDPATGKARAIPPAEAVPPKDPVHVNFPLVERGVGRMVREAEWGYLAAGILILPLSYLITSYRWHVLLEAQQIHIGIARTFVINMVGAFYNSFMPGSTGGDVAKAYYAAKHTTHRTRAVLTVIVDRVLGLLALLVLGGGMAAAQWHVPECRKVAIVAGAVLGATAAGLVVFYTPALRWGLGLDWFLRKLPMQAQVQKAVEAMEAFGRRPLAMAWVFACSFPVHVISILSATMAGLAFQLPLQPMYYWVIVPVIALVGAIPISPQGAGVQEYFAFTLTQPRGASMAHALALVMSIRLTAIFWNLVAGLFVLRGGYHAPTEAEQHELEVDAPDADGAAAAAAAADGGPAAPVAPVTASIPT